LSSFDSVKQCAADFNQKADRLDILFLNAGISTTAPALTEEGYETQFGINYMGHALLTQLLMPKLLQTVNEKQGNDARIMVTSSMAAHFNPPATGLALDQMKTADPLSSPYQRYAHSKVAKVLFARKLSQIYPSIISVSFNPGQVKTDLFKKAAGINKWVRHYILPPFLWLTGVSAEKGAENGLWAATSKDVRNGAYYEPVGKLKDGFKHFTDQKLTDELWEWTNKELAEHGAPGWPEA
jgi:NAD(P)-dependent dehydrogenase (short-subunit alcohol dehydrogenase family)